MRFAFGIWLRRTRLRLGSASPQLAARGFCLPSSFPSPNKKKHHVIPNDSRRHAGGARNLLLRYSQTIGILHAAPPELKNVTIISLFYKHIAATQLKKSVSP